MLLTSTFSANVYYSHRRRAQCQADAGAPPRVDPPRVWPQSASCWATSSATSSATRATRTGFSSTSRCGLAGRAQLLGAAPPSEVSIVPWVSFCPFGKRFGAPRRSTSAHRTSRPPLDREPIADGASDDGHLVSARCLFRVARRVESERDHKFPPPIACLEPQLVFTTISPDLPAAEVSQVGAGARFGLVADRRCRRALPLFRFHIIPPALQTASVRRAPRGIDRVAARAAPRDA